jgi:hypothetical protein
VGPLWSESSWDTEKAFASFSTYCHQGKTQCPLYRDGDEVQDIENRFHEVEKKLQDEPLYWIDERSRMPVSFGYSHLRAFTFQCLYSPLPLFEVLASLVSDLHEGLDNYILKILAGSSPFFDSQPFCGVPLSRSSYAGDEAGLAVMCGDKRHPVRASSLSSPNVY